MDGTASAVVDNVANLAIQEASFLCDVHGEVESLRQYFIFLQTLSATVEAQRGSGRDAIVADYLRRIKDAEYEAANIIDAADYMVRRNNMRKGGMLGTISRYAHKPMDLVARHKLGKDVLRWRKKILDIKDSREFLDAINVCGQSNVYSSSCMPRLAPCHGDDASVVGLTQDVEVIEKWLRDCSVTPQLTVISIVAMGGAGKTTLARKVCKSAAVKEHFDAFAFVSISQQFEVRTVLKEITTQVMGIKKQVGEFDKIGQANELEMMGEQDLAEMLRRFLESKRFLIVLDDIWRMNTWQVLQHAFPDTGNGSRLMLTTRDSQMARQANRLTRVHIVGLLNEEESWQLFSLKAFPPYECIDVDKHQELERVGRKLANKCHGLPLALVVLGSYLSKNLSVDIWSRMERSLDWEVTREWDTMQEIIALSYDDMQSRSLKDCFLYIASFPEDFLIKSDHLMSCWVAERFLQFKPNKTLEEVAYDCLEELVQRSMVHVVEWNVHEQISTVQMHDILREWAIRKAREEGFLKVCKSCDDVSVETSVYRLSFLDCFNDRNFTSAPSLRSILGFYLPCVTLGTQRFIRVLYMVETNLEKICEILGHLIHLRYIGLIRCRNVILPSTVGRLLYLHAIDLAGTSIPHVPKSLWCIPTLRHIEIPNIGASFAPTTVTALEQSELRTLIVKADWHRPNKLGSDSKGWIHLKRYLMRMAQLKDLVILSAFFLPVDILIGLKELRHLQRLHLCVWESMGAFPEISQLPQNLRVLGLHFHGSWNSWHADMLPTLGRLQSLVNLTLYVYQFDENQDEQLTSQTPIISSPTRAFPRLRYLFLSGVQANKLRFEAGTMPNLIELTLIVQGHMTTVPAGLFRLPSLKSLVLHCKENLLPRETSDLLESNGIRLVVKHH